MQEEHTLVSWGSNQPGRKRDRDEAKVEEHESLEEERTLVPGPGSVRPSTIGSKIRQMGEDCIK
jgi:hypothetical protein